MTRTSTSTNCSRHGLTLIEVVAGLALMGTLVAAMLSAKGRFTAQHYRAQRVLYATEALDSLLLERWPDLGSIERTEHGELDNHQDMAWRASVIENLTTTDLHCRVIRIEVIDTLDESDSDPLVDVELLAVDPTYRTQVLESDPTEPDTESTTFPPLKDNSPGVKEPAKPIREERVPVVLGVAP